MPPPLPTTAAPPAVAKAEAEVGTDLPQLIAAHQRPLWRYLRLLGADAHEADDLVQDTFVVFASRSSEAAPEAPAAFLRGIAKNLLLAARRRARRQPPANDWAAAVDQLVARDEDAFADGQLAAVRDCLQKLPERARQAVQWHHVDGLSRRDTAERLGLGDEGTKSLLQRARELLRDCIERSRRTEENR